MHFKVIFFIFTLSSCTLTNEISVEEVDYPNSFINEGHQNLDINWWNSFNNDELSQLVSQGLKDNLSLKAQDLRLKNSAINANIAEADFYPTLDFNTSASSSFDDFGDISNASFGLSSSWELDIWGGIAAVENKAVWDYKSQEALYRARANLVAGNITNAWLGLVSEQQKKIVLANQFRRTQDSLTVISRRFSMGKNSVTNIWQQQNLLKSIEVQQEKNIAELYINKQKLALWLGITTDKLLDIDLTILPQLPTLPVMGIPTEQLKYRPDVEQAFAKIKAANEHLAVAISDQYPRFTLRANYSTSKTSVKDLLDDWTGNLIASLTLPLFDAGVKKSIIEQRKLVLQALIFDYQQVWLDAISIVNQVLVNETQLSKVTKNLSSQLDLAQRTEKLTTIKYLNGKTNYLNLLKAQESILLLERQIIDANKRVMINRVLLYRELSHGDFSTEVITKDNENIDKGKQT
jgi:NodT family efflux transporter outer membrane factor (OMF) lipoprotein